MGTIPNLNFTEQGQTLAQLRAHDQLKLPAVVITAIATLDTLNAKAAEDRATAYTFDRLVSEALENENFDHFTARLAELETAGTRAAQVRRTLDEAQARVFHAIRSEADAVVAELEKKLYAPHLKPLLELAKAVPASTTVEDLIDAGDVKRAQAMAEAKRHVEALAAACDLRDRLFGVVEASTRADVQALRLFREGGIAADVYANPALPSRVHQFMAAVQADAQPWFPTPAQLAKRRADYLAECRARAEAHPPEESTYLPPFGSLT